MQDTPSFEISAVPAQLGLKAAAFRQLWLSQHTGQAKAIDQNLALAWPSPGCSFCM